MDIVSGILSAIKLPIKIVVGITILAIILLLMPEKTLEFFSLEIFVKSYRQYISLVFLIGSVLVFVNLCSVIYSYFMYRSNNVGKKSRQKIDNKINDLDFHEKIALREFIIQGKSTIQLPINDSVIAGLIDSNIIQQVGQIGQQTICGMLFSFKINDYALSKLSSTMLGIPDGEPDERTKIEIMNQRPNWAQRIDRYSRYL